MRDIPVGALVRVRLLSEVLVAMPDLQETLDDLYWCRDVATAGLPHAPPPAGYSLIVGPTSSFTTHITPISSVAELLSIAANVFGLDEDRCTMCTCSSSIDEAAYRGRPYASAWAIAPRLDQTHVAGRTGVFIDPRHFGEGILFHVFHAAAVSPDDVTRFLGYRVPDGFVVKVAIDSTDASADRRPISSGSLITVWVESVPEEAVPEDRATVEADGESEPATEDTLDHSWRRPFNMSTMVFGLQTEVYIFQLSVLPEDDLSSIAIEILGNILDADKYRMLVPIDPQPNGDSLIFAMTAAWITLQGRFPVMVDSSALGGARFITFFNEHFDQYDVDQAYGGLRPENSIVWLPGPRQFLGDQRLRTGNGMLIVLLPRGQDPPGFTSAADRLSHPQSWARCLGLQGLPSPPPDEGNACLIGPYGGQRLMQLPSTSRWTAIRDAVRHECELNHDDFTVVFSGKAIRDTTVRGHPVSLLLGVCADPGPGHNVFFLDCRDLGYEVALLTTAQAPLALDEVLCLANVRRPALFRLDVRGAELFTPETETLTVGRGSFVVVTVAERINPPTFEGLRAGTADEADDEADGPMPEGRL